MNKLFSENNVHSVDVDTKRKERENKICTTSDKGGVTVTDNSADSAEVFGPPLFLDS